MKKISKSNAPRTIFSILLILVLGGCTDIEAPTLNSNAANNCADGFFDPNGNESNGCECELTNADDIPDFAGIDSNCDGVDGIIGENGNVVFVSLSGLPRNNGFISGESLNTIAAGIKHASNTNRPYVLVAAGHYNESITLENGISIFGGYDPATWKRDIVTHETFINGDGKPDSTTQNADTGLLGHYKTLTAKNIADKTIVSGFTVVGQNAEPDNFSASTFALWSENSENLFIQDSLFIGGQASAGSPANDAPPPSCTPQKGGAGGQQSINVIPCELDQDWVFLPTSGSPGAIAEGNEDIPQIFDNGGKHVCKTGNNPDIHGTSGRPGVNGRPSLNSEPMDSTYLGGFSTSQQLITWTHEPQKSSATNGGNGNGGQGGGAGGSYQEKKEKPVLIGGRGGKGGSGGCGGYAAKDGHSGGSSFGIVVLSGKVTFHRTHITLGAGADAGKPGTHTEGTKGADGQPGTSSSSEKAGNGANGGRGGDATRGGKAIGGIGGHAIGLAYIDDTSVIDAETIFYDINSAKVGNGQEGWKNGQKRAGKQFEHYRFPLIN